MRQPIEASRGGLRGVSGHLLSGCRTARLRRSSSSGQTAGGGAQGRVRRHRTGAGRARAGGNGRSHTRPRDFSTKHSETEKTAPITRRFFPQERDCEPISLTPRRICSRRGRCSVSCCSCELSGVSTAPSTSPAPPPTTPLTIACMVQLSRKAWPGSTGGCQGVGKVNGIYRRRARNSSGFGFLGGHGTSLLL